MQRMDEKISVLEARCAETRETAETVRRTFSKMVKDSNNKDVQTVLNLLQCLIEPSPDCGRGWVGPEKGEGE